VPAILRLNVEYAYDFPDLPAAEAEFRKREAALLGREA
jgi:hypothetical protein